MDRRPPKILLHISPISFNYLPSSGSIAAHVLLLDAKAGVNAANKAGVTPLIFAASQGKLSVVKMLLLGGADRRASFERCLDNHPAGDEKFPVVR